MLVNRRTFMVKPGKMDEVKKLVVDYARERGNLSSGSGQRILTGLVGPFDVLVLEVDHENLAAYERFWAEVFDHPSAEAFFQKWNMCIESGGTNEIWEETRIMP